MFFFSALSLSPSLTNAESSSFLKWFTNNVNKTPSFCCTLKLIFFDVLVKNRAAQLKEKRSNKQLYKVSCLNWSILHECGLRANSAYDREHEDQRKEPWILLCRFDSFFLTRSVNKS